MGSDRTEAVMAGEVVEPIIMAIIKIPIEIRAMSTVIISRTKNGSKKSLPPKKTNILAKMTANLNQMFR
jgi:hypothetical protein